LRPGTKPGSAALLVQHDGGVVLPPPLPLEQQMEANELTGMSPEKIQSGAELALFGGITASNVAALAAVFSGGMAVAVGAAALSITLINSLRYLPQMISRKLVLRRTNRRKKDRAERIRHQAALHAASVIAEATHNYPEAWTSEKRQTNVGIHQIEKMGNYEVVSEMDENGTGFVTIRKPNQNADAVFSFYPGAVLGRFSIPLGDPFYADGFDLRGASLQNIALGDFSFEGADLRGVNFKSMCAFGTGSFRNANCTGASFWNANFTGMISPDNDLFEGAILDDADFTGALLPEDLTKMNLSGEQLDSLELKSRYRVAEISPDEARRLSGVTPEDFLVAMWAGDVEVRDRRTNEKVMGEFNADEHYIPAWAARKLQAEHATTA
jgi:hypothetical protein